jgi:chromosome segregation protein
VLAREAASREAAESAARIAEIRQAAQTQQEELAVRRAAKAALDERFASAAAIAARLEEERRELSARATALDVQQQSIAAEQEELVRQNEEQQRQAAALRAECQRLETRKIDFENEWNHARTRTTEVDDALRTLRQTLSDLREERGKHEIERARNDAEREHLREACVNELNAQPEDLIAEQPSLLTGEELAAADAQYQEMKARIASMGPVNMMALEEYNECEQRFGFLGREREDLLQSIADTQQAITELDEVSRQRFEEAFAIINTHFAGAFQTLFGGGTGQMRLSEADSSGEAGIDIAAQPPGKRLQNVLLLSGGEKALTALALLIAIFRYQPSPFCILDEVDAPLDETNVGRFAQMVAEMSADAQFIVVTHNRRTMEMASVLYGVTMQEPGVSKLVSVNWDQARAAAASNAA